MNLIEALQMEEVLLTETGYRSGMRLGKFHEQPFGYVNGGALLAFGEITAGKASNQLLGGSYYAVGQSVSANHMKAMKAEGILYAEAEILHKGNNSHVWSIRMVNQQGVVISLITVTNTIVQKSYSSIAAMNR